MSASIAMVAHLQDSGNFEKKEPEAELQPQRISVGSRSRVSLPTQRGSWGLRDAAYRKEIERIICVYVGAAGLRGIATI
jgi:hypothetical protein